MVLGSSPRTLYSEEKPEDRQYIMARQRLYL
jgi:hypothetical protein